MEVPFELVQAVLPAVREHALRTPLLESARLSERTGGTVLLKCENLQRTGSFKLRGALAALAQLREPERGVFTVSTGNHGQALACAAQRLAIPCTVVVPRGAAANKVLKIRARGARVLTAPFDGFDDAQAWALESAALPGAFVSAYEDAAVAAGNGGTCALELFEQAGELDAIVVPSGGGGLVVGIGVVARALAPRTRVVAVNPIASPALWLSRRDGRAHVHLASAATLADAVEGGVGAENYRLSRGLVDDVVTVSETSIRSAMRDTLLHEKLVVEGAGALGVAAVTEGLVQGRRIAVLLTGGNVDTSLVAEILAE